MKKYLLTFLFIFSVVFSQKIVLVDWQLSPCENFDWGNYHIATRISKLEKKGDLTFVTISFQDDCTIKPKCSIKYSKDSISLKYKNIIGGGFCGDCAYELTYVLKGEMNPNAQFYFNDSLIIETKEKYKTYPTSFQIINNDTINRTDKYGVRQGLWVDKHKTEYDSVFYKNGQEEWISNVYISDSNKIYVTKRKESFTIFRNDTLNCIDKNGKKQGIHINLRDLGYSQSIKSNSNLYQLLDDVSFYKDDKLIFYHYKYLDNNTHKTEEETVGFKNHEYLGQFKNGILDTLYLDGSFYKSKIIKNKDVKSFKINKQILKHSDVLKINYISKSNNHEFRLITPNKDTLEFSSFNFYSPKLEKQVSILITKSIT